MLVYDCETDGLLDELTTIHCLTIWELSVEDNGECVVGDGSRYNHTGYKGGRPVEEGIRRLEEAEHRGGHNVIKFDEKAIKKVYPWYSPKGKLHDSLVYVRVIWTDITERDFKQLRKGKLPEEFKSKRLTGRHSLKAWGYRLGNYKGDFTGPWGEWTEEMDDYCMQDGKVTTDLFKLIFSKEYPDECLDLEMAVAEIISRQEDNGVLFDVEKAEKLQHHLESRRAKLEREAAKAFDPWYAPDYAKGTCEFTPKTSNKKLGYTRGATFCRVKRLVFNPQSRAHIADRLQNVRGWKPKVFTKKGRVEVNEKTLDGIPWPEAKILKEYLVISKRLGTLSEGKQALLKHVKGDGRIHGYVSTNGAVTGRMTHSHPNMNLPSKDNGAEYGEEFRELFTVMKDNRMVGVDADGLEGRTLGHFMAKYDGGTYANMEINGDKTKETDPHSLTRKLLDMRVRNSAKRFRYAYIYGAGDLKLGSIIVDDYDDERRAKWFTRFPPGKKRNKAYVKKGRAARRKMEEGLPALGKLVNRVKSTVKAKGYLKGLDGRKLHIRSPHAAINTLLQSAGAVVMKRALVIFDDILQSELGLIPGQDFKHVLNVHDEFQVEAKKEIAEQIKEAGERSIKLAGEYYNLRCELAGSGAVGITWNETH